MRGSRYSELERLRIENHAMRKALRLAYAELRASLESVALHEGRSLTTEFDQNPAVRAIKMIIDTLD